MRRGTLKREGNIKRGGVRLNAIDFFFDKLLGVISASLSKKSMKKGGPLRNPRLIFRKR